MLKDREKEYDPNYEYYIKDSNPQWLRLSGSGSHTSADLRNRPLFNWIWILSDVTPNFQIFMQ